MTSPVQSPSTAQLLTPEDRISAAAAKTKKIIETEISNDLQKGLKELVQNEVKPFLAKNRWKLALLKRPVVQKIAGATSSLFSTIAHYTPEKLKGYVGREVESQKQAKAEQISQELDVTILEVVTPKIKQMVMDQTRSVSSQACFDFAEVLVRELPSVLDAIPSKIREQQTLAIHNFLTQMAQSLRTLSANPTCSQKEITEEMTKILATIHSVPSLQKLLPKANSPEELVATCVAQLKQSIKERVADVASTCEVDAERMAMLEEWIDKAFASVITITPERSADLQQAADSIDTLLNTSIPYAKCTIGGFLKSPVRQWVAIKIAKSTFVQQAIIDECITPKNKSVEELSQDVAKAANLVTSLVTTATSTITPKVVKEGLDYVEGGSKASVTALFSTTSSDRALAFGTAAQALEVLAACY